MVAPHLGVGGDRQRDGLVGRRGRALLDGQLVARDRVDAAAVEGHRAKAALAVGQHELGVDGGARGAPELAVVAALVGVGSGDAGAGAARQRARAADGDGPQDARDVHRHSSLVDRPDICPSRRDATRGVNPG